jgi:segregation and condensation protein B
MPLNIIEALIFASGHGMHRDDLYKGLKEQFNKKEIDSALETLRKQYSGDRGMHLILANNIYQFQSNPAYGDLLADLLLETRERQLSKTLLQVLAIIAYKQPVTRTDIEDLRGVGSDYVIAMLLKLNLIEAVGRKETIGKPILYGTTTEFLKKFGLETLEDLPDYEDLMLKIKNNFEKYYAKEDTLFRDRNIDMTHPEDIIEEAVPEDEYFGDEEEDIPDFLSGEDIVEIE